MNDDVVNDAIYGHLPQFIDVTKKPELIYNETDARTYIDIRDGKIEFNNCTFMTKKQINVEGSYAFTKCTFNGTVRATS